MMNQTSNCGMPAANIPEPVVLVNIGREWHDGLSPDQLYERTHGFWYCNPRNHSAEYALAVANGIVREAYRIFGWHRLDLDNTPMDPTRVATDGPSPKQRIRWCFDGERAPELSHYVGKSVKHYRKHGNANPLIWLNSAKNAKQAGIDPLDCRD